MSNSAAVPRTIPPRTAAPPHCRAAALPSRSRGITMRTTPVAVTAALLASLTLAACGGEPENTTDATTDTTAESSAKSSTDDKPTACEAEQFAIDFGPSSAAPAAGDTGNIPVTLTNRGGSCVLQGSPDTDVSAGDKSWTVRPEQSAEGTEKGTELTLAESAAATFTITYVRGAAGDPEKAAAVDTVTFTLPGDSAGQRHKWPDAEVAVKSANELDITVSPFLPAGD